LSQSQRLTERRKNAAPVSKINTPRHPTSIAQHPNPPYCGWDIRPPANIPQRKREGDCPNRSGCPSGEKMPTKSRKSIPRATRPPLPAAPAPHALRMGHPPSREHSSTQTGGRLSQSQRLSERRKNADQVPKINTPRNPTSIARRTHTHRTADGTSALPRTFLSAKGRAIVPIAAAGKTAKKCPPKSRTIKTQQNQTAIAPRPHPPHCGWDIRPPANIPQRKREGDCPNRSGCPSGEKMPTKSRKSIPRATRPPLPSTQAHRTADGTSALPTFALPDIRPPAPSRYKFDSR